tara:strand:- start:6611 stop:7123 length:513 start_codon:yes stop_codon:yes gene_type:complete
MNNYSIFLTFLYVVIAALLLIFCLATSWKRWIKVLLIFVVTFSYFIANTTFEEMLGWPTPKTLPDKFVIISATIEEPNQQRGIEGAIYLWVSNLDSKRPGGPPRSFSLPYLKHNHSELAEAQRKSKQGIRQIGIVERPAGGSGSSWFKVNVDKEIRLKVKDAPESRLPEK